MIENNRNTHFENLQLRDKQSFCDALYGLLEPYERRLAARSGRLALGANVAHYDDGAAELEAVARPLWGLAGACKHQEHSQFDNLAALMREKIAAGVDEHSPYYWGNCAGKRTQRYVEMAPLALAFSMSERVFWQPLSQKTKESVIQWLTSINVYEESVADNNWRFFRILVNTFLKNVKAEYSSAMLELDFAALEGYYLGEGWYRDGRTEQMDHYIGFAMHFYALLYAELNPNDEERCARYKERALLFARDFVAWFAADGSALAFGRSLTYRFAHASFWAAYLCARVYTMPEAPVSLEEAKGLLVRNIAYWLKKPIFDNAGFLTIGYGYPNLSMSEGYNAPGSPYWALKAFHILSLSKDDPFWRAEVAALPVEKENRMQKFSRFMFSRSETGDVVGLTAGGYAPFEPRHHKEKYAKFAYAPHFGFTVSMGNEGLTYFSLDNTLAFSSNGVHWSHKGKNTTCVMKAHYIYTQWELAHVGVRVNSVIIPISGCWHLRAHSIMQQAHGNKPLHVAEGGFSTPYDYTGITASLQVLSGSIAWYCDEFMVHSQLCDAQSVYKSENCAFFNTAHEGEIFYSGLWDLSNEGTAHVKSDYPHANILYPRSMTPMLLSTMHDEKTFRATLVYCERGGKKHKNAIAIPKVSIEKSKKWCA